MYLEQGHRKSFYQYLKLQLFTEQHDIVRMKNELCSLPYNGGMGEQGVSFFSHSFHYSSYPSYIIQT